MIYAQPGQTGSKMTFKKRYDNFINGEWVAPFKGKYTKNIAPATGKPFCEVPCSSIADLDLALDAAHAAREGWGKTPVKERAAIMNRIADRIEENTELLALAEAWDKGKVIKDVLSGDIPGTVDTYRYFAACIRAQTGEVAELDHETVCCHFREPLGVVGAIIPWNYSLLMAGWKLGPALAAGNCVILKPASLTPASVLVFAELIADLLVQSAYRKSGADR
jgi:aldehyde dehydrogenase